MQEIVNFFSFLINVFRQLLTLHNGFRRFMTLFFTLFLFLILYIIFFSIIFLFHSHNFFLRSFCHIVSTHSRYFTDFSPPATAVMFLLAIHPTASETGDFLSTGVKNNASSTFSKSKKCNASFFSNFCFSLPPYTGISSRQMRYRLHPPASFLSRPSMERHSPLFRSANSDPADNLPLLY